MAPIDVVGSKMAPDAMYGQNGADTPSSVQKGEPIKRSKVVQTIIQRPVAVPTDSGPVLAGINTSQMRTIDASPIAKNSGIYNAPTAGMPGAGASPRPSYVASPRPGGPGSASVHTNTMPAKGKTI